MDKVEEDHQMEDFPQKNSIIIYNHRYRVKLILKDSTLFKQGEYQMVNTAGVLKGKFKRGKHAMHLAFDFGIRRVHQNIILGESLLNT